MVFWGIHSNLSEINVMKDHQAHKQAICQKNNKWEAQCVLTTEPEGVKLVHKRRAPSNG